LIEEKLNQQINFFNNDTLYVLYSGTSLELEEDAFRHLNDLYLMHLMLIRKGVNSVNITLSIDLDIFELIDEKTNNKKYNDLTFKEFFEKNSTIIDINDFEKSFNRKEKDLIFISSGHGEIHGLHNGKNNTYISSDYFENLALPEYRTILLMSQCIAGSFHHLDTRKNICVIGASEYQSSLSLDLQSMCKIFGSKQQEYYNLLSFFNGVAINPFLFSFFMVSLYSNQLLAYNKNKNLIHIYKYTASSTYNYLQNVQNKIDFELVTHEGKSYIQSGYKNIIQVPYLLNKILASRLLFN